MLVFIRPEQLFSFDLSLRSFKHGVYDSSMSYIAALWKKH